MSNASRFCRTCAVLAAFGMASTVRAANDPGQRHLIGRSSVAVGDRLKRAAARQPTLLDRAVGHHRHAALIERRQEIELRAASRDVVEDLIP